jgi:MFS transporter, ACS family, hexuronate transporter
VSFRAEKCGWRRWFVCFLLFSATSINYMDRSVLGILGQTLEIQLHWTEDNYANIVVAFTCAYGIGYVVAGRVVDRIGTKAGYALFVFLWTAAAMAHATVTSVGGFAIARFALGFAESGNFPAAIRAISEWFPPEERALATGLFNSGSNSASLVAPFFIAFILSRYHSWRYAFFGVGSLGLIWLLLWLTFPYDGFRNAAVTNSGLAPAAVGRSPMRWQDLLRLRQTWAFIVIKAMTDPVWWLYLFWLPKFLQYRFHLSVSGFGAPLAAVYCISSLGAVGGGWLSGYWIRSGIAAIDARKRVLLVCAVLALLLIAGTHLTTVGSVVFLFSVLTAAHQAWAANLFVANSDIFPRSVLSTVVGIGGAAGAFGGVCFQEFTGYVLQITHGNYALIFLCGALAYPLSLAVFHLLTRKSFLVSIVDTP